VSTLLENIYGSFGTVNDFTVRQSSFSVAVAAFMNN